MLIRRSLIAIDLVLRLFSTPRALAVVALPFILWYAKRLFLGRSARHHDLIALFVLYGVIGVAAFVWQFAEAGHIVSKEPGLYAEIEKLDSQEQSELRRLVLAGKMTVGPPVFDRIAAKTSFMYRDVSGEWRIEQEYKWFLWHWERQTRNK